MNERPMLYVVATPIGNLGDMSHRAVEVLKKVDALACEDTRRTRILMQHYGIPKPRVLFSCHEHNENRTVRRITKLLAEGLSVAICTNAGFPGVSDPGYRAVKAVLDAGGAVCVLPGASAVTAALMSSGLPSSSFTFKGFAPRKPGPRRRFLESEAESPHTLIFFEAPNRLGAFLSEAANAFGERRAAVCIELTKMYEEIRRGSLRELAADFAEATVRGEVTVVIEGKSRKSSSGNSQGRKHP
jgi:16S rRNA (cytidine1402-2'-O)-methyltransferase